jgi:hypothetical protein
MGVGLIGTHRLHEKESGMATIRWQGNDLTIVPDGAVLKSAYDKTRVRVLHILREPTLSDGLGQELLGVIRPDGTVKWRIWKVTARRSYAIQQGLPKWRSLDGQRFGDALRTSAVVNLNDTISRAQEGRWTTNMQELCAFAQYRWPNRLKKIKSLRPDLIVCGGTWDLTKDLLQGSGEKVHEHEGYFIWNGTPCVYAYHPSFRGRSHEAEYNEFHKRCSAAMKSGN